MFFNMSRIRKTQYRTKIKGGQMALIKEDAIRSGYQIYCLECKSVYIAVPTQWYEDGNGGRNIQKCKCGGEKFAYIRDNSEVQTITY